MSSFRWPLLVLLVLTLIALAGYLTGFFPREVSASRSLSVSRKSGENNTEILLIRLRHASERTHWSRTRDDYRIDIRRQGPDLYSLKIALIDRKQETETRRQMNTSLHLEPGRNLVGGFTVTEPGGNRQQSLSRQKIVVEVIP